VRSELKAEREHDSLMRITQFMIDNKKAKFSASLLDVAKALDVSAATGKKLMDNFTNKGYFRKDKDLKKLWWLNIGDR